MKATCSFLLSHWRHGVVAFCGAAFLISLLETAFSLADPRMAAFMLFCCAFISLTVFATFSPRAFAFYARATQDDQRAPVSLSWLAYIWFMMMVPSGCLACVIALRRVLVEDSPAPPFEAVGATLAVLGCLFSAGHMRAIRNARKEGPQSSRKATLNERQSEESGRRA